MRLLIAGKEDFLAEAAGVLKSGLESAAWITVDDTGARYKGMNGACTHIGNTDFAWFATTRAKSRLNFLALLRAGATDYVINDEALAYMRSRSLSGLRLGITRLRVHPDPLRIATEGALWCSVVAHIAAIPLRVESGSFRPALTGCSPPPPLGGPRYDRSTIYHPPMSPVGCRAGRQTTKAAMRGFPLVPARRSCIERAAQHTGCRFGAWRWRKATRSPRAGTSRPLRPFRPPLSDAPGAMGRVVAQTVIAFSAPAAALGAMGAILCALSGYAYISMSRLLPLLLWRVISISKVRNVEARLFIRRLCTCSLTDDLFQPVVEIARRTFPPLWCNSVPRHCVLRR